MLLGCLHNNKRDGSCWTFTGNLLAAFRIAISAVYAFSQREIINIQKMVYIQT